MVYNIFYRYDLLPPDCLQHKLYFRSKHYFPQMVYSTFCKYALVTPDGFKHI